MLHSIVYNVMYGYYFIKLKLKVWVMGFHNGHSDLCRGHTEHLSSPEEAQAVCLGEWASILQPGQGGCWDTWSFTLKLQYIINHHRNFRWRTRALDSWRVWDIKWKRRNTSFHIHESNTEVKSHDLLFHSPSTLRLKCRLAWPAVLLATQV